MRTPATHWSLLLIAALGVCGLASIPAAAAPGPREVRLPADAGYVDATKPPYNAVGDGVTDCTAAIQKALDEARYVYLPAGTYLVSDIIHWGLKEADAKRKIIQGQSRDTCIIKLKDHAEGYDNPQRPKEVLRLASRGNLSGPANAFRNALYDLTVDVGHANPGAIGVLFYAHNQGAMENVRVLSPDINSGWVGIDLYRGLTGPCLVKNVAVEGFNYGIRAGGSVRQITFSNINLRAQRLYGMYNDNNVLSIENLTSDNTVPAIHNRAGWGFVTVVNADLGGGSASAAAIENINGVMFVRNIKTTGYGRSMVTGGKEIAGPVIEELSTHGVHSLFDSPRKSLNLPVESTPEVPLDPPGNWVAVTQFKPVETEYTTPRGQKRKYMDWSPALQQAVDSGATTIYFPPLPPKEEYNFATTVLLRGKLRRMFGSERSFRYRTPEGQPGFKVVDGEAPVIVLEHFGAEYGGNPFAIEIDTTRTVVIKNAIAGSIRSTAKPGKIFLEDVCTDVVHTKGKKVWARQLNPEPKEDHIINEGGTLWIMGLKTEQTGTIIKTIAKGRTELLGGLVYINGGEHPMPMFVNEESSVSLSVAACCHNGLTFEEIIHETRSGQVRSFMRDQFLRRDGWGLAMPLYVGYEGSGASSPSAPEVRVSSIITDFKIVEVPDADAKKPTKPNRKSAGDRVSLGSNLIEGEIYMVSRQFTAEALPEEMRGADFIRVNGDLNPGMGEKPPESGHGSISFRLAADADVYITLALPNWEPLSKPMKWIYSYNSPPGFPIWADVAMKETPIYRRRFKAGQIVELPAGSSLIAAKRLVGQ